jgi:hypothetical protein
VLSAAEIKKLEEDERRANIIAIREEKGREREEERLRKEEEKATSLSLKKNKKTSKEESTAAKGSSGDDVATVFDARWAKSLKPNDLKQELKNRNLTTQGSKKDLLARLTADLQAKA